MRIFVQIQGTEAVRRAVLAIGGGAFQAELFGPASFAAARIISARARTPNFRFTDRSGRLRRSIHPARIPAVYGGRSYKRGRAGVYAGGILKGGREPTAARQAHLVERGTKTGNRARLFLQQSLIQTHAAQSLAFGNSVRRRWPALALRYTRRFRDGKDVVRVSSGSLRAFSTIVARRGLGAGRGIRF